MAVDRGGLRYTIEVRDQFTRQLKRFRSAIAATKKELAGLRGAQAQVNDTKTAGNSRAAAGDREQLQRIRQISAALKQKQANEALSARILNTQRTAASRAARQDIELFRRRKTEEAKATNARVNALRKQQAQQAKANKVVEKGAGSFNRLTASARRSEGAINRVSFTFRRLIGIFAAFQAARVGASLFRGGIAQGITFNQTIEDSTISMAALFVAAGKVTNEQGKQLKGAEAFTAAMGESRRQTNLLRKDALGTVATFQELLRAFQAGTGPGLEAGLKLDEIREVTVRVSQAAAALLVPQNQLIEEIRSLLRGTIQERTTIVASVLNIRNPDIEKAKKAGNLFNFLRERLGPFAEAAEATRGSFTGLMARIKDATAAVTGDAASGLFVTLKDSLLELFVSLVTFDEETGAFVANAKAVAAVKPLFDSLSQTILDLRAAASGLSLSNVTTAMGALGAGIQLLAKLGTTVIQGLIAGVSDLSGLFGRLGAAAGGINLTSILELLKIVVRIATVMIGLNLTMGITKAIFVGLIGPVFAVGRGVGVLAARMAALQGTTKGVFLASFVLVLAIIGTIGVALKKVIDDFAGFNVKAGTFLRIISEGFFNLVSVIGNSINALFVGLTSGTVQIVNQLGAALLLRISLVIGKLADALEGILPAQQALLEGAQAGLVGAAASMTRVAKASAGSIADAQDRLTESSVKFFEDINKAIDDDEFAATGGELADGLLVTLTETITAGLDELFPTIFAGAPSVAPADEEGEKAGKAFVEGFDRGSDKEEKSKPRKFLDGIIENFKSGLTILRGLVNQFSGFVSDAIVDAFDPNSKGKDLQQKFAKFLQGIVKLIISELVKLAIAKALLGAFGSSTSGVGTQLGQAAGGLAEGGPVPDGHGVAKMARPKGLDPRDTTPIFAQPGEFMMKLAAVKNYGGDVMDAINRGLIDPSALRGLISGKRSTRHISGISSRGPAGYAEGGIIQSTIDSTAGASSAGTGSDSSKVQPVMAVNDQTMETLLNGGSQAFRRYLQDNAQEFDGILRAGRTG